MRSCGWRCGLHRWGWTYRRDRRAVARAICRLRTSPGLNTTSGGRREAVQARLRAWISMEASSHCCSSWLWWLLRRCSGRRWPPTSWTIARRPSRFALRRFEVSRRHDVSTARIAATAMPGAAVSSGHPGGGRSDSRHRSARDSQGAALAGDVAHQDVAVAREAVPAELAVCGAGHHREPVVVEPLEQCVVGGGGGVLVGEFQVQSSAGGVEAAIAVDGNTGRCLESGVAVPGMIPEARSRRSPG